MQEQQTNNVQDNLSDMKLSIQKKLKEEVICVLTYSICETFSERAAIIQNSLKLIFSLLGKFNI